MNIDDNNNIIITQIKIITWTSLNNNMDINK